MKEKTLAFTRNTRMDYLSLLVPAADDRKRAPVTMVSCPSEEGDGCDRESLPLETRVVFIRSDGGILLDIDEPHEMRFSFRGDLKKSVKGDAVIYLLGEPAPSKAQEPSGEFVSRFDAREVELNNIPKRDTFLFDAAAENANNHWYLDNMMDDVHEVHLSPHTVREVRLNLNHPMLTTATIKLDKKRKCQITADAKWITERRKLYCP